MQALVGLSKRGLGGGWISRVSKYESQVAAAFGERYNGAAHFGGYLYTFDTRHTCGLFNAAYLL